MLVNHTRQYYFALLKEMKLGLKGLKKAINYRFDRSKSMREILREWESLTLNIIMVSHPEKIYSVSLEIFIENLSEIKKLLPSEYCNEIILQNKLLNDVKNVELSQLTYQKPEDYKRSNIRLKYIASRFNACSPTLHLLTRANGS